MGWLINGAVKATVGLTKPSKVPCEVVYEVKVVQVVPFIEAST